MPVYKMMTFTDEEAFGSQGGLPSNVTELIQQRDAAIRERDSYKESAESWSTRAAQEQLRAEQAEQELGKLIAAIRMNVIFTPGETDAEGVERTCVELRELVVQAQRELDAAIRERDAARHESNKYAADLMTTNGELAQLDAARQSRARLIQLWNERGIPARSWHAAERTWKP